MTRKDKKTLNRQSPGKGFEIVDPKAPKEGDPIPVRGVGSLAGKSREKILTANGRSLGKNAWARALGISRKTLDYRLKHHPVEVALSPNFREIMLDGLRARKFWNVPHHITEKGRERLRENARKCREAIARKAAERKIAAGGEVHTVSEWGKILKENRREMKARARAATSDRHPSKKGGRGSKRGR